MIFGKQGKFLSMLVLKTRRGERDVKKLYPTETLLKACENEVRKVLERLKLGDIL